MVGLSWLSAIIVGAGCLALGYIIGARYPSLVFASSRLVNSSSLVSASNKKKKEPLEVEKLADILEDFKMVSLSLYVPPLL